MIEVHEEDGEVALARAMTGQRVVQALGAMRYGRPW
jgi:hypothetical protein